MEWQILVGVQARVQYLFQVSLRKQNRLCKGKRTNIIVQIYASANENSEEEIKDFYFDLDKDLSTIFWKEIIRDILLNEVDHN